MGYRTREERLALQDDDPGGESDTVFAHRGTKVTHYHDREDCRCLRSPVRPMTRKAA